MIAKTGDSNRRVGRSSCGNTQSRRKRQRHGNREEKVTDKDQACEP